MPVPGSSRSYWLDSAPATDYRPLTEDLSVDVAIIGGGIVGVTAAYLLKEQGLKVALVEARRIVNGVTGHTTAKLTALQELIYTDLLASVGRERAHIYADANRSAVEFVADLVARRGIECDFRRMPAYTYAEEARCTDAIQKEVEAANSAGVPAVYDATSPLPFETFGAVRLDDQALFHPVRYLQALAAAIPGDGSHIFERTRALDVDEGSPSVVMTDRGRIRATDVIVATHYPILDRGFYFGRLEVQRSYVVAIRASDPPPEGLFISTYPEFYSIRPHPTPDGWLIFVGGFHHKPGAERDTGRYYDELERYARTHFAVESVPYHWSTQDNWPLNKVPYVGRYTPLSNHLYVATGFHGWGMTNGTAAARILADLITDRRNPWAEAFSPERLAQLKGAATSVRMGAQTARHLITDRFKTRSLKPESLQPGEGRVGMVNGERVAVSRDMEGNLHAVTAACGHQGCIVAWNRAEQSWDCPCHGSRYAADGSVIHGPTVKGLKAVSLTTGE